MQQPGAQLNEMFNQRLLLGINDSVMVVVRIIWR